METKGRELLIIFYRNPEAGRVKTRLAATIGNEDALRVYLELCKHARQITENVAVSKVIFYTEQIQSNDIWPDDLYQKELQSGSDLGARMHNSFEWGFNNGFDSICIIGTDCLELSSEIIKDAFTALRSNDVVIGPAVDGGYYLLGMRRLHSNFFTGKRWSTETVFADTVKDLISEGATYVQLPRLRDVDVEADIPPELSHKLKQ